MHIGVWKRRRSADSVFPDSFIAAIADRYEITDEIGRGGMSIVYLANDLEGGLSVAVKVLRPELIGDVSSRRFLREIELMRQLDHPRIVPLLDAGEQAGLPYCVTEYLKGESLRVRLKREAQLQVRDALVIACDVAEALEYAHVRGLIHRDIKPENILLSGSHAIVSDFGLARAVGLTGRVTQSGYVVGTVKYMSPEQSEGERELDVRTDVYSLGCVLYEMFSGDPPFTGSTPPAVVARKLHGHLPSLRLVRPDVTERQEGVIAKALQRDPADRYAECGQFLSALRGLLHDLD
jgi:serine/threonine-protein kinase